MKPAPSHEFPRDLEACNKRAVKLEWLTLLYLASIALLMYLVMGSSQAMKTAWFEDLLSMVPPIMFLLSNHYRSRTPDEDYPYGFHRITDLAYFGAALALLLVGGFLVYDGALKLLMREHPTIGMKSFFGLDAWLGWWMIAVLLWGTFPPVLLGIAKKKLAEKIFDKVLYTDAEMNKADWMTAVAAIVGVLGIGFGLWWADAAAALFISFNIIKDGWRQTRDSLGALVNRAPRELDGSDSPIPGRVLEAVRRYPWVDTAEIRIHEQGHLLYGEVFVHPKNDRDIPPALVDKTLRELEKLDWRLHSLSLTITSRP